MAGWKAAVAIVLHGTCATKIDLIAYPQGAGTVIAADLALGTPAQKQRVQVDTGSELMWVSSTQCKPYKNTVDDTWNQQEKCVDLPDALQPDGPIGYDYLSSSTANMEIEFLWRSGYGTGGSIPASTVAALDREYPGASFGTQTGPESEGIYYESVVGSIWRNWVACANMPACASQRYGNAPLGGPMITDVLSGSPFKLTFQSTLARKADANLGNCNYPVNGIVGMGVNSRLAKTAGINQFTLALRQRSFYIDDEAPAVYTTGALYDLPLAHSAASSGYWTVSLVDFKTSDGKVTSAKVLNDAPAADPIQGVVMDSGTTGMAFPPAFAKAMEEAYSQPLPEDVQAIWRLQGVDGGVFEVKIPLSTVAKTAGPSPISNLWILGAPVFMTHTLRFDYPRAMVSIGKASDVDATDGLDFTDVIDSDATCQDQFKQLHITAPTSGSENFGFYDRYELIGESFFARNGTALLIPMSLAALVLLAGLALGLRRRRWSPVDQEERLSALEPLEA